MAKKLWDRLTKTEQKAINKGVDLLGELRDKVQPEWREQSVAGAPTSLPVRPA